MWVVLKGAGRVSSDGVRGSVCLEEVGREVDTCCFLWTLTAMEMLKVYS